MNKIIVITLILSSLSYNAYANDIKLQIENVRQNCSGIKSGLDTIFGLTVATTVSSGLGTVASGGAVVAGVVKTQKKYNLDEDTFKTNPELFENDFKELVSDMKDSMNKIGNVRTALIAGATLTSAVSTGTSIGSTITADKLAKQMEICNTEIQKLRSFNSYEKNAEHPDINAIQTSDTILSHCKEFDKSNIKQLKNMMTASAIVSGIGTGTGTAGTITSAIANKEQNKEKAKKLDTTSNILAGVTMGTSGASTALSAKSITNAKKDLEIATQCEEFLNK